MIDPQMLASLPAAAAVLSAAVRSGAGPVAQLMRAGGLYCVFQPLADLRSAYRADVQVLLDTLRAAMKAGAPTAHTPFAVAGVAWDGATTNRPGARLAPRAIRQASHMLCDGTHPLFDLSPAGALDDLGDLPLPNTSLERMREALAPRLAELIRRQHMVFLGGDHSITLPLLRPMIFFAVTLTIIGNLQLFDEGPDPKYDGVDDALSLVPLVSPMRPNFPGYPAVLYPNNIAGETPNEGMANQITALTKALGGYDHVTVEDLPEKIRAYESKQRPVAPDTETELVTLSELERRYVQRVMVLHGGQMQVRNTAPGLRVTLDLGR